MKTNERQFEIDAFGQTIPVLIERSSRAKRIKLKVSRFERKIVLVLPKRASEAAGVSFAKSKAAWMAAQLSSLPEKKVFADGMSFSYLGKTVGIHHSPTAKRGVWMEEGIIFVSGEERFLPRRVKDFLKKGALVYATERARELADNLGVRLVRVSLRDTTSRWGSCSRRACLSLSWRLSLAPLSVFDYVIAHEVAHLRQMNHSKAFWDVVKSLCPEYEKAELWLKKNTAFLYSFDA